MVEKARRTFYAVLIGAVAATVGVAGAGHIYLREWHRGIAWFSFVLGTGLIRVSVFSNPSTVMPQTLPVEVTAPLVFLAGLSVVDAYYLAAGTFGRRSDGTHCASCGSELDPTLDFCPWCGYALPTSGGPPSDIDLEEELTSR
ncbi:MAG: DUF7575 domain-containing protein [Halobacteriota archaeon]